MLLSSPISLPLSSPLSLLLSSPLSLLLSSLEAATASSISAQSTASISFIFSRAFLVSSTVLNKRTYLSLVPFTTIAGDKPSTSISEPFVFTITQRLENSLFFSSLDSFLTYSLLTSYISSSALAKATVLSVASKNSYSSTSKGSSNALILTISALAFTGVILISITVLRANTNALFIFLFFIIFLHSNYFSSTSSKKSLFLWHPCQIFLLMNPPQHLAFSFFHYF